MVVPEHLSWVKDIRVGNCGIVFGGGKDGPAWWRKSRYAASLYVIYRNPISDPRWVFAFKGVIQGVFQSLQNAKWGATQHLFESVARVDNPDVTAMLMGKDAECGDWLYFRVLADLLGDLGYHHHEKLVRHFIPKNGRTTKALS